MFIWKTNSFKAVETRARSAQVLMRLMEKHFSMSEFTGFCQQMIENPFP
jgi:hypothetical protein